MLGQFQTCIYTGTQHSTQSYTDEWKPLEFRSSITKKLRTHHTDNSLSNGCRDPNDKTEDEQQQEEPQCDEPVAVQTITKHLEKTADYHTFNLEFTVEAKGQPA